MGVYGSMIDRTGGNDMKMKENWSELSVCVSRGSINVPNYANRGIGGSAAKREHEPKRLGDCLYESTTRRISPM